MSIERVCVLGGSGFIGRHIVHRLHAHGYGVRVVTRDVARNRDLRVLPGVEVTGGNPLRESDLDGVVSDMDAVINLVGILTEKRSRRSRALEERSDFEAVHEELPRLVVAACYRHGIHRLLHMSANGADPQGPSRYLRTKGRGAEIVRAAGRRAHIDPVPEWLAGTILSRERDFNPTVFEPSIVFGEGDLFFTRFARLVRWTPLVFPLPGGETRMAPVWVEDVAEAFARSLEEPSTYQASYPLCGPHEYAFADLIRLVAELEEVRRKVWPVPSWLATLQALVLERLPGAPLTRDQLASLSVDNTCDRPFPSVLGIDPQPLEAVVPSYVGRSDRYHADLYRYREGARRRF